MAAKVWSGVTVEIQSALATAIVIDSVSKASPGVVGYTGTDPASGNFLLFTDMQGMFQLDDRVLRIANEDTGADTFELEGLDTSAYGTFTSGNAQVVTFGTTLAVATDLQVSPGEYARIPTTTIHNNFDTEILGNAGVNSYNFTCQWDPADAGLIALEAASDAKSPRAVKITFADGTIHVFYGNIGFHNVPGGSAQQLVTTNVTISAAGRARSYAS